MANCKIPRVTQCCCGCPLREGTKIIAIVFLVLSAIAIPGSIWEISEGNLVSGIGGLCQAVASIVCCALLLKAVKTSQKSLLLPWLILEAIGICSFILAVPGIIILAIAAPAILAAALSTGDAATGAAATVGVGLIVAVIIGILLMLALHVYLFIVVHSFYLELKEAEEAQNNPVRFVANVSAIGSPAAQPPSYQDQAKQ